MIFWLEQNAVDLVGYGLTLIGIVAAAVTVVWQIGSQYRSSLNLQRENAREKLKLRVYETLVSKIRELSHANTRAAMYAYMIPFNIENYQTQISLGTKPTPIKERAQELSNLNFKVSDALVQLIEEFEAWAIAFPGRNVFQTALNSANYNAQEAFRTLFDFVITVLPIDLPKEEGHQMPNPHVPKLLSAQELDHLRKLVACYKDAMDEIGGYVYDLTVESQNNLLSGLFDQRVPKRRPLDHSVKVVSTEPDVADQLLHYFENETPWGKSKQATEADVRASLEKT